MTDIQQQVREVIAARAGRRLPQADDQTRMVGFVAIVNVDGALDDHAWDQFVRGMTDLLQNSAADVSVTRTPLLTGDVPVAGFQASFVTNGESVQDVADLLQSIAELQHVTGRFHVASWPVQSYQSL